MKITVVGAILVVAVAILAILVIRDLTENNDPGPQENQRQSFPGMS